MLQFKGPATSKGSATADADMRRRALLAVVDSFRPIETALEIGSRGKNGNADLMKDRRKALTRAIQRRGLAQVSTSSEDPAADLKNEGVSPDEDVAMAGQEEIDVCSTLVSCRHHLIQSF